MLHSSRSRLIRHTSRWLGFSRNQVSNESASIASASSSRTDAHDTASAAPSPRELRVEALSDEVFSKGNRHLKNVETLTSLPEGLHSFPEVCFIGKPNVGKSTLIASLLHNPKLAKGTTLPGTTRLLQFFNVGDALLLVDTPGYGGWKGRRLDQTARERANAFSILFRYLALRKTGNLKRVFWLVAASARHPISFQPRDREIYAFLARERIPFTVVLSKIDRHWRHWSEETRAQDVIGKDGLARPSPLRTKYGGDITAVERPEAGVRRNMEEIYRFLGTDQVPILGVCANRWNPRRCRNLTALQHDIVGHCVADIPQDDRLTYKEFTSLSYAPPLSSDIQRVHLQYPVEAFVVPQNDWLSLPEMVARHEASKANLLGHHVAAEFISARDMSEGGLLDSREVMQEARSEELRRQLRAEVALKSTLLSVNSIGDDEDGGATQAYPPQMVMASSRPRLFPIDAKAAHATAFTDMTVDLTNSKEGVVEKETSSEVEDGETVVESGGNASEIDGFSAAKIEAQCGDLTSSPTSSVLRTLPQTPGSSPSPLSASVLELPFAIERGTHCVTAIDGTPIPRSLISVSVEQLAVEKPDEMPTFALRSGAGAYEELMQCAEQADTVGEDTHLFVAHDDSARLSEAELESLQRIPFKSAALKRKEKLLSKYIDKARKERSVYMHAEGYMCPWVGSVESTGGVLGAGAAGASTGKGGALLKGLKQRGFGGRSYSARTMKNRGRATKKTGPWAA